MPDLTIACPICDSLDLRELVRIDQVPVYSNVLWSGQQKAQRATRGSLFLTCCYTCGHLFNSAFDPGLMDYGETYENSLHFSPRFDAYARELAQDLRERHGLSGKTIVEIGSGQGDFLSLLCKNGRNQGIGFDPSYRPGKGTEVPHLRFIRAYYEEEHVSYDVDFLCCRHVLEHVPDPGPFIRRVWRATERQPAAVVFFEVPNVLYTLRDMGIWDLIYEHFSYFSPSSLTTLFRRNGFAIHRLRETFGAQFLTIEAMPERGRSSDAAGQVPTIGEEFLRSAEAFAAKYNEKVSFWEQRLRDLAQAGQRTAIWGAGSKGVTFLNVVQATTSRTQVVDVNPRKQGKYVAGTGHEIIAPRELLESPPDVVIVMNPNYHDEIRHTLRELGLNPRTLLA